MFSAKRSHVEQNICTACKTRRRMRKLHPLPHSPAPLSRALCDVAKGTAVISFSDRLVFADFLTKQRVKTVFFLQYAVNRGIIILNIYSFLG